MEGGGWGGGGSTRAMAEESTNLEYHCRAARSSFAPTTAMRCDEIGSDGNYSYHLWVSRQEVLVVILDRGFRNAMGAAGRRVGGLRRVYLIKSGVGGN